MNLFVNLDRVAGARFTPAGPAGPDCLDLFVDGGSPFTFQDEEARRARAGLKALCAHGEVEPPPTAEEIDRRAEEAPRDAPGADGA